MIQPDPTILLNHAAQLEAQANINDAYAQAMRDTTRKTNGHLGHLANPTNYAAHLAAAANKRARAQTIRDKVLALNT